MCVRITSGIDAHYLICLIYKHLTLRLFLRGGKLITRIELRLIVHARIALQTGAVAIKMA
ncbi:hypothetical protein CWE08_02575 [Aliidiomarina iranensis]|uniref:Uncharacterized protein n=1 Tax=Aliidiomarina iranensis TaxID=1434071 RepID=A0A432W2V4_9GAMM|nr:hypothetical protein CWE08_02575 [Aliidiomarina iranensis]